MILHKNPWFKVTFTNNYYRIELTKKEVIILPIVEDNNIILVDVKRPNLQDDSTELPAGHIEKNEKPVEAAAREFAEETGIVITDLKRFIKNPSLYAMPNRISSKVYVYSISISNHEYASRYNHDDEIAKVSLVSFKQFQDLVKKEKLNVGIVIGIISSYFLKNFDGKHE
jgi:ADP-ribose pyrophosphatase